MSAASTKHTLMRAVQAERVRRDWTQAQLAERLGWERKTLSRIETGERSVLAEELPALCAALGVPLSRLLLDAQPEDRQALGL